MFDNISLADYNLAYELQRSQFLCDCLDPEIDFKLKDDKVVIYKKLESGISEQITIDKLIYIIQFEVAEYIYPKIHRIGARAAWPGTPTPGASHIIPEQLFHDYYKVIDNIRKAVLNMGIILKYGELEEIEVKVEEKKDESKEEPLMKEVSTKILDNEKIDRVVWPENALDDY